MAYQGKHTHIIIVCLPMDREGEIILLIDKCNNRTTLTKSQNVWWACYDETMMRKNKTICVCFISDTYSIYL